MRVAVALCSVTLLWLAAPFPVTASGDGGPPEHPHRFLWDAPADASGDLLVEVLVDWGDNNECAMVFQAAGERQRTGLGAFYTSGDLGWGTSGGGNTVTYLVQAHAGDIDTRDITDGPSGAWGTEMAAWGAGFGGVQPVTFGAFDIKQQDFGGDPWGPFSIDLGCRDPFSVLGLAGSDQVIGFRQGTMEGTGASVNALVVGDASLNVEDGHDASFDTDHVRFAVRGFQGGGAASGQIHLEHPEGAETFTIHNLEPDVDFVGAPGDYRFAVTRAGVATTDLFWGFLGGLDAVEDLDDLFP